MTNKKTQHDSLNVEQTLISSEAFIDKYKKPIMYVFIAIVVLVGGYFLYRSFVSEPREAKANELMFKGQQYFASDNYEKALNGDGQGFPGFLKIANDYGSTKAGNLAQLYAGLSYAKLGKYQEAVTRLEDFKNWCIGQLLCRIGPIRQSDFHFIGSSQEGGQQQPQPPLSDSGR